MSPETDTSLKKRASSRKTATIKRPSQSRAKRKAPTSVHTKNKLSVFPLKLFVALCIAFIIVTVISVYIGTRDKGPINVSATMSERATLEASKGNGELSETIKAAGKGQVGNRVVDDALVGAGNKITEQQKQKMSPKSTEIIASSSNATATSSVSTTTETIARDELDGAETSKIGENLESEQDSEEPSGSEDISESR